MELHGFSDASQNAMAAAVYLRVTDADGNTKVSLLCSKTQVAPLKTMTIPRLELSAAWLLTQLILHVKEVQSLENVRINLWTDSAVTLAWIKSPAIRWKTFVRNRVGKIQETLRDVSWKFIPGKQNPADCASRGIPTLKLKQHALWWHGPTWLHEPKSSWPTLESPTDNATHREERQGLTLLFPLLRKLSIWHRAIDRFKRVPQSSLAYPLTPSDLERAKLTLIKFTQGQYFAREIHTLEDSDGGPESRWPLEKRIAGPRREASSDTTATITVTLILIDDSHRKTLHGGTQLTLADLRKSVWIIGGRVPVRSFILRCVICTRQRGEHAQQLMRQLPAARVQPTRAFLHTGLDYAGPITLKTFQGRGAKTYKGWIAVFVCMFRADKELKRLFAAGSRTLRELSTLIAQDGTNWKFNPPGAPHFGGKWEVAVKSIKFHLRRTIGDSLLTLEQYSTLLAQIEAILNSRPLTPLNEDPADLAVLTPGHFLIGQSLTAIPEPSLTDLQPARLSHWEQVQQMIKVGSVVLITTEDLPPTKWPLAKVIAVHPGEDGQIRVVTVKTVNTELVRPITKLCVLPLTHEEDDLVDAAANPGENVR
ncbi:uncharacterized protein LOC123271736 [Cotesia glomerata]|uniref:uncharacterized protein LOC123271736 n=1 Tax=Cotesia glomerata TaxID=32391 RepID=UPI001D00E726|nr:uncharacterized protein LOC123271736 [Cotesia glomerata]